MNKDKAIKDLIALACCTVGDLSCLECPRYEEYEDEEFGGKCLGWTDNDMIKAVKVLNGEIVED